MESALAMREVGRLVRHGRPDVHSPFFISYAHISPESDKQAEHFYNELRGYLQTLVALPVGTEMGFFDQDGIEPAVHWDEELADALGTCQVLVALLSVPYLGRDWCGREWHAFTLREKVPLPDANGSPNLGPILPVRWAPIPFKPPPAVGRVQFFTPKNTFDQPNLVNEYEEEGIFRLMRAGNEKAFGEIVWQLAKYIQHIYYSQWLKPRNFEPDDLRNIFESGVVL
jgi:hypothetical protein